MRTGLIYWLCGSNKSVRCGNMVLDLQTFNKARCSSNHQIKQLFQLRCATQSFLVQCLADREILKKIPIKGPSPRCYGYNSSVIHQPQLFSQVQQRVLGTRATCDWIPFLEQFPALSDHGWDSAKERPVGPALRRRALGPVPCHTAQLAQDNQELKRRLQAKISEAAATDRKLRERTWQVESLNQLLNSNAYAMTALRERLQERIRSHEKLRFRFRSLVVFVILLLGKIALSHASRNSLLKGFRLYFPTSKVFLFRS